ncbi:CLUMA_CG013142, isoform B [Clunio marinus]|uniref:CD109 antigen n=1 Tax=Clunio marinus TaxID=568069 RepID=A0A1J1IJW7_9DIPT|nr:CLUMA_CG013142, isoform B [Clunio marinus]
MSRIIILLIASATLFQLVRSEGYFTIVGSKIIRPDTDYHLSITSQGYKEPTTLSVSVNGTEDNGSEFLQSKEVTLISDQTQTLGFDLNNLRPGDYKLNVKSVTGKYFERSVSLDLNTKKHSIFIQTDKSIYKPADKVQFRVLVLDSNTKPFPASDVKVHITDGGKNRIKQYSDVRLIKGVYQNELQLSDLPVMGNWMIHVKVNDGEEVTKSFEVAEYVLPKYEVIVDSNPHVTFKDGKIRATVRSKYTFGKPVKGQATVSAYPVLWLGGVQPFIQDNIVRKVIQVDGKGSVEFDIREELKIEGDYERYINIEAIFEEELTGRRQNGSTQVTIHKFKYNMELVKESDTYKPGLPYNIFVKVADYDGAPLIDKVNPVKVFTSYAWNEEDNATSTDYYLDKHGMAEVKVIVPVNTSYLSIKARYLDSDFHLGYISQAKSFSNQYLQAKIVTDKPKINQEVSVDVMATEEMNQLTYQVLGRGDVIISRTLQVPNSRSFNFRFLASFAMVPKANLVVYYIRDDGEIISDKLKIELSDELQNFIDIKLSSDEGRPGDQVSITVNTKPNSYVGLLGVDQSVLLLKKGNDIEKSAVFEELERYNEKTRWNRRWHGDNYVHTDFESSGAVIITNAKEEIQNNFPIRPIALAVQMPRPLLVYKRKHGMTTRNNVDEPFIRTVFPESWIYEDFQDYEGTTTLSKKVPDTITSWIITGFSVDPITGLGLTKQPSKFNVFQPFFVSTNLPYSIKRGEVVAIPIVVFNYMEGDQRAEVTFFNEEKEFEFAEVNDDENQVKRRKRAIETQRKKNINVKSQSGTSLSFMIRPLKVGHITIKVTANSAVAGDGVERQLIVEPEGVTQYKNEAVFIDLRNNPEFKTNISITIPPNAVPDSTRIEASAIGDILGPSIDNLDKLIKLPYGCGEQNMLNFVPNIVVLDYLTTLNKLTPEIESKAKKYMESGYQRELGYKHDDGSYSAFGKSDDSGSTWLTAFVAKSFHQASKYIMVEESIIKQALDFLVSIQAQNGSFPEVGHVSHKDMQGGSSKGIALTAYTLITFLENDKLSKEYQETIDKALNYVFHNLNNLDDSYSLAIAAYALQLAKHSGKDSLLSKLEQTAVNENGMKYWEKSPPEENEKKLWYHRPSTVNVEMSAYALQAFVEAGRETDAFPVMKWLVTQRNENGGFQSTQDTVVGLQALSKLGTKVYDPIIQCDITVKYHNGEKMLNINEKTALILQKYELSSDARNFEVTAKGKGVNILQLSYKYNMNENDEKPRFVLEPEVESISNKEFLQLKVCTNFVPDESSEKSNMAVMEVSLPSGFTYDTDAFPELLSTRNVKNSVYYDALMSYTSTHNATISKKVPDTITSWIITGFSVDPITGLGLTKQPSKFNVFQPFFVSTNLPYSIKRGEVVAIPIVVFNYMEADQRAEVTFFNEEKEFEFAEVNDDENQIKVRKRAIETQRKKNIIVKSQSGTSLSFMIRPLKVGHITIKVTANSAVAGDGVERQLIVEPEGVTQYKNEAVFIDLRNNPEFKTNISITIPPNAVPDSTRIEASAIGDILGPSIDNLDKLIKLPYGCGEQNMLNFVPNIVVLDYLTTLNKLTPEIESKAKKYMESGYQRELGYKHDDGSYSAFGKSDDSGSTWLTAFVAKSFHQASKYIMVEESIIKQALDFLVSIQAQNGSFPEVGHVSHKDMQGGSSKGIALTAYTLITFLENKQQLPNYQNAVNKALDFLVRSFNTLDDSYSLAIAAYALQLAKYSSKDAFLSKIDTKSENKNGMKYWEKPVPLSDEKNPWNSQPNSINIEMSAYALQAFIESGLVSDAVPIMKWLVTQRNENGGFQSTQDTVVGLQALSKLAARIFVPNSKIDISMKYTDAAAANLNVNSDNSLILQKYELPSTVRDIEVTANGRGFGILQLSYQYNMNVTGAWPRFVLDPQVNRLSTKDFLHLTVCTSFVPDDKNEKSNMAVMEVSFPSGYTFDSDTIPFIRDIKNVKRVETKAGDTVVVVYFDDIDKRELCPVFKAYRTHKVAKQKPAPVIIYDYYDNSRRATQFYRAKKADLCDICEGDDCGETCRVQAEKRISERSQKSVVDPFAQTTETKGQANKISSPLTVFIKVETKDGETMIVVYFDDLSKEKVCPQFKAYRTHSVAKQKPAPIIIYDYYDNSRRATSFYNPPEISLCDICDGAEECKEDCEHQEINVV